MSPVRTYESCENIDNDQKIWRFKNFKWFEDILHSKSLYFRNAVNLALDDAHEGRYSEKVMRDIFNKSEEISRDNRKIDSPIYPIPRGNRTDFFKQSIESLEYTFVNCWHINNVEYDFMWKLYAKNDLGIAIQTTYGQLCKSLNFHDFDIHIAPIDYEPELEYRYLWEPILIKREHFKPEQELRIWVCDCSKEIGIHVEVDLDILIEKIYVKPKTTNEQLEEVKKLLYDYRLNKPVLPSTIDIKPEDYEDY